MASIPSKHGEITRELRNEIASGKYGTDGRLPSEAQLVKRFGVSRPTTAQALRTLEHEGLLERRAGSGTFVTREHLSRTGRRQMGMIVNEKKNKGIHTASYNIEQLNKGNYTIYAKTPQNIKVLPFAKY